MKRFLTDSLIFMFLVFVFMGLMGGNTTGSTNNNISSFDQNFNNNQEIEDGYVNGEISENINGNAISDVTCLISDKIVDVVNGGVGIFKKILKSFLN